MKFLAVCLVAVVGVAVGMPVESEVSSKVKDPVPLIVSDYSSVAKDAAVPVVPAVVPQEVAEAERSEPEAVTADTPTESSVADDVAEKDFAEEVRQEEKLLQQDASAVEEQTVTTTEDSVEAKSEPEVAVEEEAAAPVEEEARKESEEAAVTTEAAQDDAAGRVVREVEDIVTEEPVTGAESREEATTVNPEESP